MNPIASLCSCFKTADDEGPLNDSDTSSQTTSEKAESVAQEAIQRPPYCQCNVCYLASKFKWNLSRYCRSTGNTTSSTTDSNV